MRADLDSPGITALRGTVVKRCTGIPRAWPDKAVMLQKEVEKYVERDQADTTGCARASLEYVRTISNRDKALTKSGKKLK